MARDSVMRAIREYAMNHSHQRGDLIVHGAGFVVGQDAVMLTGPKGSGKTTLLIHILLKMAANFLANDRVLVNIHSTEPVLHGIPTIISISPETQTFFKEYLDVPRSGFCDYRLTTKETKSNIDPTRNQASIYRFNSSALQFYRLLQVKARARANLKAIVFPQITGKKGTIQIKELSPKVSATRLVDCLFRATNTKMKSSLFDLATDNVSIVRGSTIEKCHWLTSKVRTFDCLLGLQAYKDRSTASEIIGEVLK